jgi:hypothetical protein
LNGDTIVDFVDEIPIPAPVGWMINRESSCAIITDFDFVRRPPLDPFVLAISAQKAPS